MVILDVSIALFLWLVIAVFLKRFERNSAPPCSWDISILTKIFESRNLLLNRFFLGITLLGSIYVLAPITFLLVWKFVKAGQTGSACLLGSSFFGTTVIAHLSKRVFKRKRPNVFPAIGEFYQDPSYPSAHSAQIVAFITPLCLTFTPAEARYADWFSWSAIFIVILVAFSRIYLQVHYPSDVFAGVVLAMLWVTSIQLLF